MDKTTEKLDKILEKTSWNEINYLLQKYSDDFLSEKDNFTEYMSEMKKKKSFQWKDVYAKIGLREHYGSDIIRMRKHPNDRDLVLKLCIAARFSYDETQHALKLYGVNHLGTVPPDSL